MPEIVVANVDVYVHRSTPDGILHLVLRRAPDRLYEGTWRMVAGKIADGEQAWQAAVRELWEETGLAPTALFAIPSMNQFYEWQTDRVQSIPAFAAAVTGNPTLNEEHDLYEWLPVDEAASRLEWPEQRRLVRLADQLVAAGTVPDAMNIPV